MITMREFVAEAKNLATNLTNPSLLHFAHPVTFNVLLFRQPTLIPASGKKHSTWYTPFLFGATAPSGPGPRHSRGFSFTHNDAPQSVRLLWTSDQPDAETCT
jgi:hypothetical protein